MSLERVGAIAAIISVAITTVGTIAAIWSAVLSHKQLRHAREQDPLLRQPRLVLMEKQDLYLRHLAHLHNPGIFPVRVTGLNMDVWGVTADHMRHRVTCILQAPVVVPGGQTVPAKVDIANGDLALIKEPEAYQGSFGAVDAWGLDYTAELRT